jgi:hypothetical protein
MVFLQNKSMVRGSSVGTEDSPMPKLAYDIWIKRYNNNLPLTSINLCAQSEIYERDREREREREREARGKEESLGERERERERETCGRDKSLILLLKKVCRRGEKSRTKGDLSTFIPRYNKGGHISSCE